MLAGIWRARPALRRALCRGAPVRLVIQVRTRRAGFFDKHIAAP
jgi:hypothetical protein